MQIVPSKAPAIAPPEKSRNHRELVLNLNLKETMLRAVIALAAPIVVFVFSKHLTLIIAPVIAYLYLTAMTRYCIIKDLWRRYVRHPPPLQRKSYGLDMNFPEESIASSMYN